MKKENRLSKNKDFQRIIESKKQITSKALVLYYEHKKECVVKIGISVSKKLGNAVFRNKTKREIKRILDVHLKTDLNYNLVLIIRKHFISQTFETKGFEVKSILDRITKIRRING